MASPLLRNMGTIGGNICLDTRCLWYNQSLTWRKGCGFCIKKDGDLCHVAPGGTKCWAAFSGDTPPALLCLDAEIEIASASGTRRMPLSEFYTGDGDAYRKLRPDELLTRVFLPESSAGYRGVYRKLRVRGSIDYPLAGVAVVMKRSNGHIADARRGDHGGESRSSAGEGRRRVAGWKNDGRRVRGGGWRPGCEDGSTSYYVCAHAGVSAGDDSSVHEAGSAGSGGELVR